MTAKAFIVSVPYDQRRDVCHFRFDGGLQEADLRRLHVLEEAATRTEKHPNSKIMTTLLLKKICFKTVKLKLISGESPGLVVMGGDSCSEGCGFKSQRCILDGNDIFSH